MSGTEPCTTLRDDDTVVLWVTGRLEPDAARAFEEHLLSCEACQGEARRAAALRGGLAGPLEPAQRRRTRVLWWAAPLGATAVMALFLARSRSDPLRSVSGLGVPPAFEGGEVRAAAKGPTAADRGMAAYQSRDYRLSARLLDSALATDSSSGVRFFLGASLLWSGRANDAIAPLARVLAAESLGPYAGEAGLLLAKALLRSNAPDSALTVLRGLAARRPPDTTARHAGALADSILRLRR